MVQRWIRAVWQVQNALVISRGDGISHIRGLLAFEVISSR